MNCRITFLRRIKHEGIFKSEYPIWPPFRIPQYDNSRISNVQRILRSHVLHQFLFLCLHGVCDTINAHVNFLNIIQRTFSLFLFSI
jgi:hypothetical protein